MINVPAEVDKNIKIAAVEINKRQKILFTSVFTLLSKISDSFK